jgi:hypothetical protein
MEGAGTGSMIAAAGRLSGNAGGRVAGTSRACSAGAAGADEAMRSSSPPIRWMIQAASTTIVTAARTAPLT